MSDKIRTWPASVCPDPTTAGLFNIRQLDGVVVFSYGVLRWIAEDACAAINTAFDQGKEAR